MNLAEAKLVSPLTGFGQLCNAQLDGQVYAQPLIVSNVTVTANGTSKNYASVAYVVTQAGTLYAISGTPPSGAHGSQTTCTIIPNAANSLTGTSLLFGRYPADCHKIGGQNCQTVSPLVSILGTPVINATVVQGQPTTGTIYVIVETQDCAPGCAPSNWQHWLYAVDISSFQVTAQVQVFPPSATDPSTKSSFSRTHIQRPGLLYANGYVYLAVSLMDGSGNPGPNGAIFRYTASNLTGAYGYFATTPDNSPAGGGVWQGGAGLAYWTNGTKHYIFFNTANGVFSGNSTAPCSTNCADSFIKLDADAMTVADSFTPYDQFYRSSLTCPPKNSGESSAGDIDWGSGGVLLIPQNEFTTEPQLAIGGDKEGGIWAQDYAALGKHDTTCDASCTCTGTDNVVQTVWTGTPYAGNVIHTNPAYWESGNGNNYLFISTQSIGSTMGTLNQYALCDSESPICGSPVAATDSNNAVIDFENGSTPSISAEGSPAADAVVWALLSDGSVEGTNPGVLYAFDALTMKQIYSSSNTTCAGDAINAATKFSVPTVANGHVYIGTQSNNQGVNLGTGTFYIFGLNRSC